jgi:alpha-L-fucosidase
MEISQVLPKIFDPDEQEYNVGWSDNEGAIVLHSASGGEYQWYAYSKPNNVIHYRAVHEKSNADVSKYEPIRQRLEKITSFEFKVNKYAVEGEVLACETEERVSHVTGRKYWLVKVTELVTEFQSVIIVYESRSVPSSWAASRYVKLKSAGVVMVDSGLTKRRLRLKVIESLNITRTTITEVEELKTETKTVEVKVDETIERLLESLS